MTPDEPSWRKPVGMLLVLAMLGLWAAASITLIGWLSPLPGPVEFLLYVATGIGWLWALPMRRMLAWMELGPTDRH